MVPNVWRKTQTHNANPFWGSYQRRLHDLCGRKSVGKCCTRSFGEFWGKNPPQPQKFACSYTSGSQTGENYPPGVICDSSGWKPEPNPQCCSVLWAITAKFLGYTNKTIATLIWVTIRTSWEPLSYTNEAADVFVVLRCRCFLIE